MHNQPEPATNAVNFFLTPARIPASAVITTLRKQLPPIPVEQCQNISMPNDLPNEFDLNLSALSPFSSLHPRREHVRLGNLNLHKVSPTSHSEPMEVDTPTITIPETSPVGDVSIQPSSEPSEPTTPQIQADTSSNTTTTKQMLEVLSELSGTQQLLENVAPPPPLQPTPSKWRVRPQKQRRRRQTWPRPRNILAPKQE